MAIVEVKRLPPSVKMPKLIYSIKAVLHNAGIKCKFWILELADMYDSNHKEAKLEFQTYEDARQVKERLDNFTFRFIHESSVLTARIADVEKKREHSRSPYRNRRSRYDRSRSRTDSFSRYYSPERDRSRSPLFRETTSNLDLELELLRKKRLVIEEERRLLMEQKKLDMIKEFGSSISRTMDYNEKSRSRHDRLIRENTKPLMETARSVRERIRPPRETTRPMRETIRPIKETKNISEKGPKSNKLPLFKRPCHVITAQMKSIITESTNPEERKDLNELVFLQLRKRLALALQNKTYLPSEKVVDLYRSKFPESSDKEFITEILTNLRMSHWHLSGRTKENDDVHQNTKTESEPKTQFEPGSTSVSAVEVKKEPASDSINVEEDAILEEIKEEAFEFTEADILEDAESADDWIEDGIDWNDGENEEKQDHIDGINKNE